MAQPKRRWSKERTRTKRSTWKLENTLNKVGIYTFDVLGYSDVILKVVSTDAPLTCHIMEMKE